MIKEKTVTAVILVAGNSTRFGKNRNKNFELVNGKTILSYSIKAFNENEYIDNIIVVLKEDDKHTVQEIIDSENLNKKIDLVLGGNSRQESVYNAIKNSNSDIVIIHDGARPAIKQEYITKCIEEMKSFKGVTIGVKSKDTIKITDSDGIVIDTTKRSNTWIIQTPQCFDRKILLNLHEKYKDEEVTDDCMLLEKGGYKIKIIEGDYTNIKVTTYSDINIIRRVVKMRKRVAIFGSTGSIGTSTLNVIRNNKDKFEVASLVAGNNIERLIEQINEFNPKHVYIKSEENSKILKSKFKDLDVYYGEQGMKDISNLTDYDIAVSALVGIAGLEPTYNMIKNGKTVALANKEVLVAGGELIINTAKEKNAKLLTVDSEHSAIMQCLNGEENNKIDKILLTASGGPFFDKEITDNITVEDALNHPTWSMGKKVTIDSSTMMNKGFEVIEAKWLFDVEPEKIQVVVHRKSLVHSMVQFEDGTIMANIGPKSMEIPIAYALNYPNRLKNNLEKLDLFEVRTLEFEKPDLEKFKCLKLAFEAIKKGHSHQVVLNAADEVLVNAFLDKKIKYTDIPNMIEKMLNMHKAEKLDTIEKILDLDKRTREETEKLIKIK